MGGTMMFGIVEVIVKGITHGQVNGRMDGLSMTVANPRTLISSALMEMSTYKANATTSISHSGSD
jgi:hypothetical protein